MQLERPHAQAAFEVVELARYASPQIAVKDRRLNAAELGARVWERRALEHMSNLLLREAEAQHDRGGRHSEHDRLLKDRVVYDNAASANALEIRRELEIVDRLRNRSYNVQRTIEGLVEMREQPREEAVRYRLADVAAATTAREAQERVDPSGQHLRQQLPGAQQELAASADPQRVREHAEQLWRSMGV